MGAGCSKDGRTLSEILHVCSAVKADKTTTGVQLQTQHVVVAEKLLAMNRGTPFQKCYTDIKTVSYGATSTVAQAVHRHTKQTVACKIIPKPRNTCKVINQKRLRMAVLNEIAAMKAVERHATAGKLQEVFEDESNFYLVMDYYSGGELFEHIVRRKGRFTESQAASIMRNIMEFLDFCHSSGVVHADLKPENIVFSHDGPDAELKVLDFGMSVFARPHENHKNVFGTVNYCSPEMANDVTGQKTDIWSAGVILYFMLSGRPPFQYANKEATLCRLKQKPKVTFSHDVWDRVSPQAKDFVRQLLTPCHKKRPTAKEALQMPWLVDLTYSKNSSFSIDGLTIDLLKAFTKRSRMTRIFWERIARTVPRDEVADQVMKFEEIDIDKNGTVDQAELTAAVKRVNPDLSDSELAEIFQALDVDGSGEIDLWEFIAATIPLLTPERQEDLAKCSFQELDRSGSGFMSKAEMKAVLLEGLGEHCECNQELVNDLESEIECMDANGDGVISLEEFKCAITRGSTPPPTPPPAPTNAL